MSRLADNVERVRERVALAAQRAGRDATEVRLIAVTKGQPVETVQALWKLGLRDFGENRVQEALTKLEGAPPEARWHLIGHLQENKVNKVLPWVSMIQSVDSTRLAAALSRRAERLERALPVLLEVKTDPAPAKHGVVPEQATEFFAEVADLPGLSVRGLMTIAPWTRDLGLVRGSFATLRHLLEALQARCPQARELSMGMSDDFDIAIAEGATMVRVGRALVADS